MVGAGRLRPVPGGTVATQAEDAWDRRDTVACVALAAATALYLASLPRSLGASDEAYYFYHAVRLLAGEVLYRDMSELVTPLFVDGHAVLFRLFGADLTTARLATGVVQVGIVLAIYAGARLVSAGRLPAAAAASVHLALGWPAWPYDTPHWVGALGTSVLVLVGLRGSTGLRRTVLEGLCVGVLLANQQQKGLVIGAGVVVLRSIEAVLGGDREGRWASLARHLAVLAGAAAAVVVPLIGYHVALAGPVPVLRQLVLQPLTGYREANAAGWGSVGFLSGGIVPYTSPALLKYLPALIAVDAARFPLAWAGGDLRRARTLAVLVVYGVFSVLSSLYNPDFIHLAFILPVVLVIAVEMVSAAVGARVAGVVALVVLVASGRHTYANAIRARATFGIRASTAFGTVDLASAREAALLAHVREVLDSTPGRELFCYPGYAALSLMAGADNPTRHDLIMPNYQSAEELQAVIDTLERRRVRYVVLLRFMTVAGDPVVAYVEGHYRCGDDGLCIRNADAAPR